MSENESKSAHSGNEEGKEGDEYRVGRRVRVVYDDGIWYPAVIAAYNEVRSCVPPAYAFVMRWPY
eukprot:3941486-Rhodomonas_salina.2